MTKRILTIVLSAALALAFPLCAGAENGHRAECSGYLISAVGDVSAYAGELRELTPDVYLTHNPVLAVELMRLGVADHAEPDRAVTLFAAEDIVWPYNAAGGGDAAELGLTGEGVRIAVIDSGVKQSNANLAGAVFDTGYDYIRDTAEMTDTVGHGTLVCQIIAGSGDKGVPGVAPGATIVPLRCFDANTGRISMIIDALGDAVDKFRCDIINMSFGDDIDSELFYNAVRHAYDSGVIIVAAAGNVTGDCPQGTVLYPAAYDEVIGVGAVDRSKGVLSASQQTEAVFTCAPGGNIAMSDLAGLLNYYGGTSFAAPFVAAELALLRELYPRLTPEDAFSLLRERCIDLGDEGRDTSYGWGFADFTELLGTGWCRAETADTGATVSGWLRSDGGSRVISAQYDGSGRFQGAEIAEFSGPLSVFSLSFAPGGGEVRLFFADMGFAPLCGRKIFSPSGE